MFRIEYQKKEENMKKIVIYLFLFMLLMSGCSTVKLNENLFGQQKYKEPSEYIMYPIEGKKISLIADMFWYDSNKLAVIEYYYSSWSSGQREEGINIVDTDSKEIRKASEQEIENIIAMKNSLLEYTRIQKTVGDHAKDFGKNMLRSLTPLMGIKHTDMGEGRIFNLDKSKFIDFSHITDRYPQDKYGMVNNFKVTFKFDYAGEESECKFYSNGVYWISIDSNKNPYAPNIVLSPDGRFAMTYDNLIDLEKNQVLGTIFKKPDDSGIYYPSSSWEKIAFLTKIKKNLYQIKFFSLSLPKE